VRWAEFAAACPELAALGEQRMRRFEVVLVGTLRRNGWPRISPCEPELAAGRLFLGMMPASPKSLDLRRDPRCVLHSAVADRHGKQGDFKLYGRALDVQDGELRAAYRAAIKARIDWEPEEPDYDLWEIDVDHAGYVVFGDERYGLAWSPERGLRRWTISPTA
jgi:hypothetical protein